VAVDARRARGRDLACPHKTIAMTQRYAHLSPAHKLNAVERLGRRRTGITTGTSEETAEERREPPTQVRDQRKEKERATGVEPATSSLGICRRVQARRGPPLEFHGLACGVRAPRCPRILRRTATETATIVELFDRLAEMALRQVRVAERHRERLVGHQLAQGRRARVLPSPSSSVAQPVRTTILRLELH